MNVDTRTLVETSLAALIRRGLFRDPDPLTITDAGHRRLHRALRH